MKKLLIVFCLSITNLPLLAQFNFTIGLAGITSPDGEVGLVLEPKFQANEMVRIGLSSKIGFASPFKSLLGDVNVKTSKKSPFYFGIGLGLVSFEETIKNVRIGSGFNGGQVIKVTSTDQVRQIPVIAPRIGFQGDFDIEISLLAGEQGFVTFGLSRVIGYKKYQDFSN